MEDRNPIFQNVSGSGKKGTGSATLLIRTIIISYLIEINLKYVLFSKQLKITLISRLNCMYTELKANTYMNYLNFNVCITKMHHIDTGGGVNCIKGYSKKKIRTGIYIFKS